MEQRELETLVKNIDERTQRIEQILPTLATKADLKGFPTQDDPKGFAMKEDLRGFATKEDLRGFATKEDLNAFPTRDEMRSTIQEEGERTRQHFNAVAERIEASVKGIAEGHEVTKARVDAHRIETRTELAAHDRRIMKLEAESLKRR
jgi:hypothetical protein